MERIISDFSHILQGLDHSYVNILSQPIQCISAEIDFPISRLGVFIFLLASRPECPQSLARDPIVLLADLLFPGPI